MPFSSLNDPVDIARAQAALDAAWNEIKAEVPAENQERERMRLAYIIASFAVVALDEADLAKRAVQRFRKPID